MIILKQMAVLFIVMMVGVWAFKKDIMDSATSKKISSIVINIANPAIILSGVLGDTSQIQGRDLVVTVTASIVLYLFLLIAVAFLPYLLRVPKKSAGTYRVMAVFSNIGFMGFPIISAVYGSGALLYASVFLIPYNILIYTYGIQMMRQGEQGDQGGFQWKKVINIGVVFCLISIFLFIAKISLPSWVENTITMLSSLSAPLSMMVIGASFATMNLKELFCDVKLLLFSVIKLIVLPIIGTLIAKQWIDNWALCGVIMVMLSTPVGSMTAMLAQEYDGDYILASKGVAITTILSVITIPIVSAIVMGG